MHFIFISKLLFLIILLQILSSEPFPKHPSMPIRQHKKLPATWKLVLEDYGQRDVGAEGAMMPIHRPFGGNINDYRYGDNRHHYAVTDEGLVGSANLAEDRVRHEANKDLGPELPSTKIGSKRYRKRRELDALAKSDISHRHHSLSQREGSLLGTQGFVTSGLGADSSVYQLVNPLHYLPLQSPPPKQTQGPTRPTDLPYPKEIPRVAPPVRF